MSKFCHNCGNQLDDAAIFCEKCGSRQEESVQYSQPSSGYYNANPNPAPGYPNANPNQGYYNPAPGYQNPAPKKKNSFVVPLIIILAILGFVVIGAIVLIGVAANNAAPAPNESISSYVPENSFVAPEPEIPSYDYGNNYDSDSVSDLIYYLNLAMADVAPDDISYYDFEYDEGVLYFYIAYNGLYDVIIEAISQGYDETFSSWIELKDSMVDLFYSFDNLVEVIGYDIPLAMIVVDDYTYDTPLLAIYEGSVIFDVMEE